jgi:hypothetical protein
MSYGGITKGFTAVAVAVHPRRNTRGSATVLQRAEMSQPHLLAWLTRQVRMPPRPTLGRGDGEIGHFLGDGSGRDMYEAIARLVDIASRARDPGAAESPLRSHGFRAGGRPERSGGKWVAPV